MMESADLRRALVVAFDNRVAEAAVEFMAEGLEAGEPDIVEILGPHLINVGLSDDSSVADKCSAIASSIGLTDARCGPLSPPALLSATAAERLHAHQQMCEVALSAPATTAMAHEHQAHRVERGDALAEGERLVGLEDDVELETDYEQPLLPDWALQASADWQHELKRSCSAPEEVALVIRVLGAVNVGQFPVAKLDHLVLS